MHSAAADVCRRLMSAVACQQMDADSDDALSDSSRWTRDGVGGRVPAETHVAWGHCLGVEVKVKVVYSS